MHDFVTKLEKSLIFFILFTIVFITIFGTIQYTLPFVLAFLFSLLLKRPTKYLIEKGKLKTSLAAFITTTIFCIVVIGLILLSINYLISELKSLTYNVTDIVTVNFDYIRKWFNDLVDSYNNLDPTLLDAINKNLASQSSKLSNYAVSLSSSVVSYLFGIISSLPTLLTLILFTIFSTYFITKDIVSKDLTSKYKNMPNRNLITKLLENSKNMLGKYLLAYIFLLFMTFCENLIGFSLLGVDYAFLLSLLCGVLDLLPIVGMIIVYIPLILTYLLQGNWIMVIALLFLYTFVMLIRQVLEPKLLSSTLKIHPVASLAAIFIGLKAYGFLGMFYCIMLLVFYNIFRETEII
ncbi:sporulation integral membrane protein YtvI [Clostridium cellulovorans]|uniref:Sporulation integral membrane protein YtvI n=1 Tax=Clostridium cellulovorans (strain ATCC 35296 / DSM 3052 / OCM 3 / 743B) TaxID=573061 RepID=D9SPC7_CLOC7|nr:sporulation integral membrane protein YtvI [Clostridium cellulovorans]ADL54029.1 sporulation integral membrane protein YtvI [Clostridium cellulovorans 743B]